MPTLNRAWVRELDRRASAEYHIPSMLLMENAGRGATEVLCQAGVTGEVGILCGKGNNGGDGLVVARHLELRGYRARILSTVPLSEFRGDAGVNARIVRELKIPVLVATDANLVADWLQWLSTCEWLVDGLLGTGAQGPARSPVAELIAMANELPVKRFALDIPSGLDCDSGIPAWPTFRADHTATFAAVKPGLLAPSGQPYVGTIHLCEIGAPAVLVNACCDAYARGASVP